MKTSILVITGPTGSGKSKLAVEMAKRFSGEIINADSVQVYKGADIGSAKPSADEQGTIKHHLLSARGAEEDFDVGQFRSAAATLIGDIVSRSHLPIVCGGTGLYVRALLSGLVETPEITEEARAVVAAGETSRDLFEWLSALDPYTAAALQPLDRARVRRALLLNLSSGLSLRRIQEEHQHRGKQYRALVVCLLPEREMLYRALDRRIDQMMTSGFLAEVEQLRSQSSADARLWSTLGYRHARSFQEGAISQVEMIDGWKRDTRRFAKRQYTWWRHQPRVLGWQLHPFDGSRSESNVKSEDRCSITDRVSDAIKCFLERREAFSPDDVFFFAIENFTVDKNLGNMTSAHCQE